MADSTRTFVAKFTSDTSSLVRGAAQADAAFESTGKAAKDAEGQVSKSTGGMGKAFAAFGAGLASGLGAGALLDFGKDTLKAASDAQQAMGGIEAVFKDSAAAVKDYAAGAAEAVGLSRSQYGQLATVLGSQLKGMGQSTGEAAKGSDQLIKLGSDLAATYGGSVSDAVNAVSSLLKGERDPIEKYGVSLKQADVDAQMAAMGMKGLTGPAKAAGEAQATLALLFGKTADAQGGFAREAGTAANEAEKQAAKTENLKAAIGDKLLPAYQGLLGFINNSLLPGLDKLLGWFESFAGWISTNSTLLLSLGAAFSVIAAGLAAVAIQQEILAAGGMIAWIQKLVTSTGLWTAAQAALNLVMSLNPIGLVIIALAALGAALYVAWTKSETFRDIVTGAWEWVKNAASAAWQWIWANAISPLITGFQWVMDKASTAAAWLSVAWDAMKAAAAAAWQWIWANAISPLINAFQWVADKIGWLRDTAATAWQMMADKTTAVFQALSDRIGQIWSGVQELVKAPIKFVVETVLNRGLIDTYNTVAGWFPGAPKLDHLALPFARGGRIPGHSATTTSDNILIAATAGEYMQPVKAVNYYGPEVMEKMRARRYPRAMFAAGGMVAPVGGPHSPWGSYPGHTGLDFPVGMGTPVVAALDGVVNAVKQMTTSYGIHVRMSHAGGLESIYAHLTSAAVAAGQTLKAGERLGLSDSTGNSTGPHLHFELRQDGKAFDPTAMLSGAAAPPGGGGGLLGNLLRPLVDKVKDAANALINQIPGGMFGEIVKGMARKALDVVAGWLGAKADEAPTDNTGNPGPGGGAGAQRWADVARQALEMAGESQALLPLLLHRIDVESGGNPNAINNWDSNAKAGHPSQGLMQTIPGTFAAYAGALAGRGITDPLANIYAAIMYTRARYRGDFARAWGGTHGYALGGLIGPALALARGGVVTRPTMALIGESGPEAVVPLGAGLGNRTYNITVHVERGAPTAEVGRTVVEQIRAFEQAAGASWRAA